MSVPVVSVQWDDHPVRYTGRTVSRYGCQKLSDALVSNLYTTQIISPHDTGISASILANLDPKRWDADSVLVDPLCIDRTRDMVEGYFDYIASLCQHK